MRHAKRLPDRTAQLADGALRLATAVRPDVNNNKAAVKVNRTGKHWNQGDSNIPCVLEVSSCSSHPAPRTAGAPCVRHDRCRPRMLLLLLLLLLLPASGVVFVIVIIVSKTTSARRGGRASAVRRLFPSAVVVGQPFWPNRRRSPLILRPYYRPSFPR